MNEQLLLFSESQEEILKREVEMLRAQIDQLRKAQFAKIGDLSKKYDNLRTEYDILLSAMCKCGVKVW